MAGRFWLNLDLPFQFTILGCSVCSGSGKLASTSPGIFSLESVGNLYQPLGVSIALSNLKKNRRLLVWGSCLCSDPGHLAIHVTQCTFWWHWQLLSLSFHPDAPHSFQLFPVSLLDYGNTYDFQLCPLSLTFHLITIRKIAGSFVDYWACCHRHPSRASSWELLGDLSQHPLLGWNVVPFL